MEGVGCGAQLTCLPGQRGACCTVSAAFGGGKVLKVGSGGSGIWACMGTLDASPMDSPIVQATLEGLKRKLAKPVVKKAPFKAQMLGAIANDARRTNTLASLRLGAACLLSFAGFLRFDELANLNVCDLEIGREFLKLKIPCSKND